MSSIGSLIGCVLVVVFLGRVIGRAVFSDPCEGDGSPRTTSDYYYVDADEDEDE
jgi:hypothetical protein